MSIESTAQVESSRPQEQSALDWIKQRGYFGGGMGAQFGQVTNIRVQPEFGVRATKRWSVGSRLTYQYYEDSRVNYSTNIFGGSLLSRYFIFNGLFGMAEYELMNFDYFGERATVPAFFVGAGYFLRMGNNFGVGITAMYDIIQDRRSPYPAGIPILNMGVAVGL